MATVILTVMLAVPTAFDYRCGSPMGLFPFPLAATDESLPGNLTMPAYLPLARHPYLSVGATQPYTINGLHATSISAGGAWRVLGFQVAFNRFGMDAYREQIAAASAAVMPIRFISLGFEIAYNHLSIKTPEASTDMGLVNGSLGLLIEPLPWLRLSFRHDNTVSLLVKSARDVLPPSWTAGLTIRPVTGISLLWNISRTPLGYVNAFAIAATPLRYVSLAAGYSRETATFAASLSVHYRHLSVGYCMRYHSHLGYSHVVGVTLSLGDLSPPSISFDGRYLLRSREERDKLNINRCSREELTTIPGMTPERAESIIELRNRAGRVSTAGLRIMGFSDEEIRQLGDFVRGIETEKRRNLTPRARLPRPGHRETASALFKQLTSLGVPASHALQLAETMVRRGPGALREELSRMNELDAAMKQAVLRICIPTP